MGRAWLLGVLGCWAVGCSGPPAEVAEPERAGVDRAHVHREGHHHHGELKFTDAEAWSKVFDDPARDAWQKPEEVVALLAIAPGMTVVDVGSGTGYFVARLSPVVGATGKVLGLDVEADMTRYLKERAEDGGLGNVEARVVPVDDPQLEPGSIDRILIVNTWHHIGSRKAYAKKLASSLKPGGSVTIVDFTMESEKGPPREHRIAPEKVIEELGAGGLAGNVVQESLPDQYVVVAVGAEAG